MNNVSGFGIRVRLVASVTFPVGVTLTQFADDADPLDAPVKTIANTSMGVNGDLVVSSAATPTPVNLSIIPGTEDDRTLQALLDANVVARGRRPARDEITMTIMYPSGRQVTLSPGVIVSGPPATSVTSAGRMRSATYGFAFEDGQRG